MPSERKLVTIVVLGDVGRSPRMRYHAASLAKEGFDVQLVGYSGSDIPEVDEFPDHISVTNVKELGRSSTAKNGLDRLFSYLYKVLYLTFALLWALPWRRPPVSVLVQNPPSIPTLPVLWFYCLLTGATFMVDWHNYGHTIMGLTMGRKHLLVRFCEWAEFKFGRMAKASFCVTDAMREDLIEEHGVRNVVTLHDRPAGVFRSLSDDQKAEFLARMGRLYPEAFCFDGDDEESEKRESRFVDESGEKPKLLANRPGLVVSSTSWTEDEDFQMFLSALEIYDAVASHGTTFPDLVVVITGKGPLKDKFVELMETIPWNRITVLTPWLEAEDYPLMLGSADLGVSLHSSSSGLDLPMKVVDMFGAGLPVAALGFECIEELVENGKNGVIFGNATELSTALSKWFRNFGADGGGDSLDGERRREAFRLNVRNFAARNWHTNWKEIALPVFKSC